MKTRVIQLRENHDTPIMFRNEYAESGIGIKRETRRTDIVYLFIMMSCRIASLPSDSEIPTVIPVGRTCNERMCMDIVSDKQWNPRAAAPIVTTECLRNKVSVLMWRKSL